jgi:hypothetical protein
MALRLCIDRIIPPRRGRPVPLGLPPVRGAADLGGTMGAVTNAAADGAITPGEAAELARVVEIFVRAVETSDFERRLKELEEAHAARRWSEDCPCPASFSGTHATTWDVGGPP